MLQSFLVCVSLNVYVLYISCVRGYISRATCPHPCNCTAYKTHHAIDCSDRQLSTIPYFGDYVEHLENVRVDLYLRGNRFEYILKNSFYHLKDRLRSLVIWNNKYKIDVARGAFDTFLDSLELLMIEPLADDIPTAVKMMTNLKTLRELHLSTRTEDMTSLSARLSSLSIRKLALVNCGFYDIAGDVFKDVNLETLILNNNQLTSFPKEVRRVISDSVLHLSLAGNRIQELKDSDIPLDCKLVTLDLSSNNITSLDEGVLIRCRGLKLFNVSNNTDLSEVGMNVFDGLSGLVIDISYTRVTKLDFVTPDQVNALHATGSGMSCSCESLLNNMGPFRNKLRGTCIDNRGGMPQEMNVKNLDINCTRYTMKLRRQRMLKISIEDGLKDIFTPSVIATSLLTSVTELTQTSDTMLLETTTDTPRDLPTPLHSLPLTTSLIQHSLPLTTSSIQPSATFDSVSTKETLTSSLSSYKPEMISSLTVSASFEMTSIYDGLAMTSTYDALTSSKEAMMSESLAHTTKDVETLKTISPRVKERKPLITDPVQSNTTQKMIIIGVCHSFHLKDLLHSWKNKTRDKTTRKLIKYFKYKSGQTTLIAFNPNRNLRSKPGDKTKTIIESNLREINKERRRNEDETIIKTDSILRETKKKEQRRNEDKNLKQRGKRKLRKVLKVKTSPTVIENSRQVKTWYLNSIVSVWACSLHATITFVAFLTLEHGLKTKQRLFPVPKTKQRLFPASPALKKQKNTRIKK